MSTLSKNITKRSEGWHSAGVGGSVSFAMALRDPMAFLRALLLEPSSSGWVQFFRYGFVGGAAFVCDFATLSLVTDVLELHYLISNIFGFCVGLGVNYWLSVRWVFEKSRISRGTVQFGLFALVGIAGLGLNELVMWWLTEGVGTHYKLSKLAATVVVYLWNFSVRKVLIF